MLSISRKSTSGHRHRIAQHLVAAAPDIAGEQEALVFPVLLVVDFQQNLRAAEDVAGIDEGDGYAVAYRQRAVIGDGHKLPQAALRVLLAVERRRRARVRRACGVC